MGRDTSLYMFDKEKASLDLYEDLQHKVYHIRTFKNYIEDRKKELGTYGSDISFDKILETIKNDINFLSPEELFEITLFFDEEVYPQFYHKTPDARDQYFESLYEHSGIIPLYTLSSTTVCYAYMFQYGNYKEYFPIEKLSTNDSGENIKSEDFLRFNDYIILLTKKILEYNLDGYNYELTPEEKLIISDIETENQNNPLLFEIIEEELDFLKKIFSEDKSGPYPQTVYDAYTFFKQSLEMKSKIDTEKNPRIIILDSY